ncbi:MAG TPA: ATP-binding protein [Planctomycetota bacterium]|nr:ATP-binding protein [Planctomycetota bacterium]
MILDLTANTPAADELSRRDELAERLQWLINLRWIALAGVGLAVFAAYSLNLVVSVWPLVAITVTMALFNTGFYGLHRSLPPRTLRALLAEALMQSGMDIIGLGLLIFFSGGLANPFAFYFTFHVVIAAILLEKQQAYTVALITIGVVLFLGLADIFGLNYAWPLEGSLELPTRLAKIALMFAISTTLMISVYLSTNIMERLRSHSRDVRRLNADLADRVEKLASAERKLAAEHQRARAILECMEEGVVVVDLGGKVLLANTAAQKSAMMALDDTLRQAGCHSEEMEECRKQHALGNHDHDEKKGDECPLGNPAACLEDALNKGGTLCPATLALLGADPPKPSPIQAITAPGSPKLAQIELKGRRFENTVSAVRTSDGETLGVVIVSRDVTERHSLERQVFHSEKLHALGNLAAGLAHELNTPLATILGYAQMLLEDDSQRKEHAAIEEQARRCKKIVQGLLDFARKTSGGRTQCSPNELAVKVHDLLEHTLQVRGIGLALDLCNPPPQPIFVAVDEIEQVLVNLITNAADAIELSVPAAAGAAAKSAGSERVSRAGGSAAVALKEPQGVITVQTRRSPDGQVLIAVEDNGPGVPEEIREQIFEPFFTTKVAGRGTGLGLPIARRIIEDHNGELRLVPRADGGSGARFEIRLRETRGRN